jgi:hypothetical protein
MFGPRTLLAGIWNRFVHSSRSSPLSARRRRFAYAAHAGQGTPQLRFERASQLLLVGKVFIPKLTNYLKFGVLELRLRGLKDRARWN